MSLSHRIAPRSADAPGGPDPGTASPPAARRRTGRWADPRLWVGIVFVLASVVAGAAVLGTADDTEAVWRVRRDVAAGASISAADLQLTRVHLAGESSALYLSADSEPPAGAHLTRDVGAGELLAVSALTTETAAAPQLLPLGVAGSQVPAGLSAGDHVDVWAVPGSDQRRAPAPALVLADVTVSAVSAVGPGGLDGDRQILVALPDETDVGAALAALNEESIVLIQVGS